MKIKHKGNKVSVFSDAEYLHDNKKLLTVTDNGNGYTVKAHSWSSVAPDMYYNIPYDTAVYLYYALKELNVDEI